MLQDQQLNAMQDDINVSNSTGCFCSDNFITPFGSSKMAENAFKYKGGISYENRHLSITINFFLVDLGE